MRSYDVAGPPVHIPAPILDDPMFRDEPHTERMAYLWIGLRGPLPLEIRRFAREWGWSRRRVYEFVRRMRARGLIVQDGATISAVRHLEAQPDPVASTGTSWGSIRMRVFARDGFACTYCGSNADLQCDHVRPRILGGSDDEANLTTSCGFCNRSKGGRLIEDWRR